MMAWIGEVITLILLIGGAFVIGIELGANVNEKEGN